MTRYRTIVADPPWAYEASGVELRASAEHRPKRAGSSLLGASSSLRYGAMSTEDIRALPVQSLAEDDAHLYLWTTNAFMVEAHAIAEAWGFKPKTILTWVKPQIGLGHYFRNNTEHVLFCLRGKLPTLDKSIPTAFKAPRATHSAKPDAFYDLVEQASPGPRMEMFARRARFGWDYWGNQSLGTAELVA